MTGKEIEVTWWELEQKDCENMVQESWNWRLVLYRAWNAYMQTIFKYIYKILHNFEMSNISAAQRLYRIKHMERRQTSGLWDVFCTRCACWSHRSIVTICWPLSKRYETGSISRKLQKFDCEVGKGRILGKDL